MAAPAPSSTERTAANLQRGLAVLSGPFAGLVDLAQHWGSKPNLPSMGSQQIESALLSAQWAKDHVAKSFPGDPARVAAVQSFQDVYVANTLFSYSRDARKLGFGAYVPTELAKPSAEGAHFLDWALTIRGKAPGGDGTHNFTDYLGRVRAAGLAPLDQSGVDYYMPDRAEVATRLELEAEVRRRAALGDSMIGIAPLVGGYTALSIGEAGAAAKLPAPSSTSWLDKLGSALTTIAPVVGTVIASRAAADAAKDVAEAQQAQARAAEKVAAATGTPQTTAAGYVAAPPRLANGDLDLGGFLTQFLATDDARRSAERAAAAERAALDAAAAAAASQLPFPVASGGFDPTMMILIGVAFLFAVRR